MGIEEQHIWTVADVNRYVRDYLSYDVTLQTLWVRGEISNFKHHGSGHMYFTLKDESSRINAVMFSRQNRQLKFIPKNGDRVLVRCSVSMYEIGGQVQLYVKEMQPDGIGNLFLAFEQLKQKLEREGLFSRERKRALPPHPRTVGVITSPTGAAVRDIVTTISRRSPYTNVLLFPSVVQGDEAPSSVAKAIEVANRYFFDEVDVLIVGRGGGSLEELWTFNEEIVARSISESAIPVIAAVGHETDVTIADFVADVRAATPTAAAELAVPLADELKERINYFKHRLEKSTYQLLQSKRDKLTRCQTSPVMKRPLSRLREYVQRVDYLQSSLARLALNKVERERRLLERWHDRIHVKRLAERVASMRNAQIQAERSMHKAMVHYTRERRNELNQRLRALDALSPLKVLERGYSLVYREDDRKIVKAIREVNLGDVVRVHLKDGTMDCQVWGLEEEKNDRASAR